MAHEVIYRYSRPSTDVDFPTADATPEQEDWDVTRRLALVDNSVTVTYDISEDGLNLDAIMTAPTIEDWQAYFDTITEGNGIAYMDDINARAEDSGVTIEIIVNGEPYTG